MAAIIVERIDGPDAERADRGDSATYKYHIFNTTDAATAHTALITNAPATVTAAVSGKTLVPTRYRITGQQADYWQGEVDYAEASRKRPEPKETGDERVSFTISGASKHVDKSLDTVLTATHDRTKVAPDFKQAIGVTKDGVSGTDIIIPEFGFQVTQYIPLATITNSWINQLADIVGTVADTTFRGFDVGRVLMTSVSGSERSETDAEVTFNFGVAKNEAIIIPGLEYYDDVTDPMTPEWTEEIPKLGWEYLWVFYEEEKDDVAKRVRKIPKFAYVEQVYDYGDWSFLSL